MTDNDDREPATDVITALGNLISRFPVTDTVKATRAAAEATATVIRQGQAVLEVHLDNARLREALAAAAAARRPSCSAHRSPKLKRTGYARSYGCSLNQTSLSRPRCRTPRRARRRRPFRSRPAAGARSTLAP